MFKKITILLIIPVLILAIFCASERVEDESWKFEVANKLYDEFCYFYNHIDDDVFKDEYYQKYEHITLRQGRRFYRYNFLMAVDRAIGIIDVYSGFLPENKVDYVLSKKEELNSKTSWFDRLSFGYTDSGMHYVAIIYNSTSNSYYSQPMCNKVRGDFYESDFMEEMYCEAGYHTLDICVEDLSGRTKESTVRLRMFNNYIPHDPDIDLVTNLSDEAKAIMEKYNRTLVTEKHVTLKNNTWNVCLIEDMASCNLAITHNDKETRLTYSVPSLK